MGLFLEIRLAFWVMLGVPISFLGAMLILPSLGVSVNMISLFAFILALGILVDDAIVVGENIFEQRQRGKSFVNAAIDGALEVGIPVVFFSIDDRCGFSAPCLHNWNDGEVHDRHSHGSDQPSDGVAGRIALYSSGAPLRRKQAETGKRRFADSGKDSPGRWKGSAAIHQRSIHPFAESLLFGTGMLPYQSALFF